MNKRWRNVGLYVLLVVVVIVVGTAFLDRPDPAATAQNLRYSDFVEQVQEDQVSRVLLSPDRGTAQVVATDGRRSEVNLAPDKDLLKMLTDHNVDIAVQPSPAFPGMQKISFTEEDLDTVDANACSLPPLPIIAIFILIFIYLINEK